MVDFPRIREFRTLDSGEFRVYPGFFLRILRDKRTVFEGRKLGFLGRFSINRKSVDLKMF